jgi:hypothetical protein
VVVVVVVVTGAVVVVVVVVVMVVVVVVDVVGGSSVDVVVASVGPAELGGAGLVGLGRNVVVVVGCGVTGAPVVAQAAISQVASSATSRSHGRSVSITPLSSLIRGSG